MLQGHDDSQLRHTRAMQVQHLRILARLQVKRNRYREAACVLEILGLRKSGPGDLAVPLTDRLDALSQAVLQVCLLLKGRSRERCI